MVRLEDVKIFVRATALGSFSNAAREAGLLPAQASAAIQRLEKALGVRLFVRSTRSLRLTQHGERYLPFAQEMLDVVKSGFASLQSDDDSLRGELKIALPSDIGRHSLLPIISRFCQANPGISLQLLFSDGVSNVLRDPVDIAVRYGELEDASFVALPLAADNRRVLVASPAYLARQGAPQRPEDLAAHECILWLKGGQKHDSWNFTGPAGPLTIQVQGRLISNDADVSRRWARDGYGIAYKSWLDVREDIRQHKLVPLLTDFSGEKAPLNFICPHRSQFSAPVRLLYQQMKAWFDTLQ